VTVPDGYLATGYLVRAHGDDITHLWLRARRIDPWGYLGSERVFPDDGTCCTPHEDDQTVHSDHILTGVGFRAFSDDVDWSAWSQRLPLHSQHFGGFGGTVSNLRCPAGHVAIGTVQNTTRDGTHVGQFGIVCTPESEVESASPPIIWPTPWSTTVVHGSYYDTSTRRTWNAGTTRIDTYRQNRPGGIQEALCGRGQRLMRVTGTGGDAVESIGQIGCRGATSGEYRPVGVGTSGGDFQSALCDRIDGLRINSGWYTDGFSFHCSVD
jgi:hypothetical protein